MTAKLRCFRKVVNFLDIQILYIFFGLKFGCSSDFLLDSQPFFGLSIWMLSPIFRTLFWISSCQILASAFSQDPQHHSLASTKFEPALPTRWHPCDY